MSNTPTRDTFAEAVRTMHLTTGHVSPDHYRERFGRYQFTPHEEDDVWAWSLQDWHDAIAAGPCQCYVMVGAPGSGKTTHARRLLSGARGRVVVFDSVASTPSGRRRILDAMPHGAAAVAIVVVAPLRTCIERNAARDANREVPPRVVANAWHAVDQARPTIAEGFRDVRTVRGGP